MKSKIIFQAVAGVLAAALLLTFSLLVKQLPAMEKSEVRIAEMEIDIWPEYDDPRVLVIYSGQLEPGMETATPADSETACFRLREMDRSKTPYRT